MNQILIIDDDTELCGLLQDYLTPEGFEIECVHDGEQGAALVCEQDFDLVILDVMLPGLNGFDVLRKIRETSRLPVLMLTARGDDVDRIVGLELGADDYLPKPFNPRELLARIRAIQRRSAQQSHETVHPESAPRLILGDIELDCGTREVLRDRQEIELTSVEFTLLEVLMRQAGQVVERENLVETVLGRRLSPYDRSIDVHVSSLRKKLGHKIGSRERIKTIRGVGYLYALSTEKDL